MGAWDRNQVVSLVAAFATVAGLVVALLAYVRHEQVVVTPIIREGPRTAASRTGAADAPARSNLPPAALTVNEATHTFPAPYIGVVWVKVSRVAHTPAGLHVVSLTWGAKHRIQQVILSNTPAVLTMHKTGTDATPLSVTVQPGALIDFGDTAPPGGRAISIDAGWSG